MNQTEGRFMAALNRTEFWFMSWMRGFMHYVYILWSKGDEKFYIGYTADLKRRMAEHRTQRVHTTCRFTDFSLIFYEAFAAEEDARRRERYFKTSKGKKSLRLMIRRSISGTQIKVIT